MSRSVQPQLVLVGLLFVLTAASPYFGRFMNANERPRLLQGMAWVEAGTSVIDGPSTAHIAPGIDVSRTPEGALVPNKPPGTTVPAAVAYALGRAAGVDTLEGYTRLARALGGWVPMMVLLVAARRRFGGPAGAFALVVLTLGTPCLAYARLLYGHVLAAACLFCGVSLLERARHRSATLAGLGGLVAGSAVAVEYLAAFAGIPIAIWLLMDARARGSWSTVVAGLCGALVPIAALMLYHVQLFGSPWLTPYHFVVREGFAEIHGQGLLGLSLPTATSVFEHLLSPWGGLIYWAPLSVLALWAMVSAVRRGHAEDFEKVSLAIFGLLLVLNVCLVQTGGWRVGPRYLVVVLPFLLPGLARVHAWLGRRGLGALVVALLGWSLLINFMAAGLFPHLVPEGNPLRDLLLPLWAEGLRPHSVWGAWGLGASGLLTLVLFVIVTRPSGKDAKLAWVLGLIGACGLLAAGVLVSGSAGAEDAFASVRSIWEPDGPRPAKVVPLRP